MSVDFTCANHTASAWNRGGLEEFGELTPLSFVRYERVRDDISTAEVHLPTNQCCELLGDLRTILHELHIYREGEPVWEGPITRIEYEHDEVRLYAEDVLWQAKRTVLQTGYSNAYPNIGYALDRMDWLLRDQCYGLQGDPWKVLEHLHQVHGGGPRTSRAVAAYELYVWQDFDQYAENSGTDYTVVNRDIYYWDHGRTWLTIPDLDERFLSQFPRIVEYGNELFTRGFVSNARGYAGIGVAPAPWPQTYGYVDDLVTNLDDTGDLGEELAAAREELADAQANLVFMQNGYDQAVIDSDAAAFNAQLLRERANVADARLDMAEQDEAAAKDWANSWQQWADEMQRQADDTGDPALAEAARAAQDEADTALDNAVRARVRATSLASIATDLQDIANLTGDPADQAAADQALLDAQAADAAATTAEGQANAAQANANAARAAANATNDPTKQAEADNIQAGANAAKADLAVAQAATDAAKAAAEAAEDLARDAESDAARAAATVESWATNVTEAQEAVAEAQAKVDQVSQRLAESLVVWADTAQRNLIGHFPSPVGIVVPANTTLLPGSGWTIHDLVPGAQFHMTLDRLCRQVSSTLMINEVRVEESAPQGERVQLTAATVGLSEEFEP